MASNDVTFKLPAYTEAVPGWELVDDVVGGEKAVKARGDKYLPKPNPSDLSEANRERYKQYKARAVFYNATGRTLQGLVGAVYRSAPELEVPALLDYVRADADGHSVGIVQQSQSVLASVLKKGRHGLFVDYPNVEGSTSRAAQRSIRANIVSVDTKQIINWRTERVDARHQLALVVIHEKIQEPQADGFGVDEIDQYRALRIMDGIYVVEVYRVEDGPGVGGGWQMVEQYAPLNGAGQPWREIPFTFVGAENNDPDVDLAPLYDLAVLNVAHYRNSADYEDSAYFVGQAQPWISGLDQHWADELEKRGLYIGSRAPILLPEGGAFGLEQAQPNTMVKEAMDQKESQMVALGARLVTKGQAVKTATQAQGEQEAEHSVLSLVVENVQEAYEQCLIWAAEYMNAAGEIVFTLNKEFAEHTIDAQRLTALVAAWQAGALPNADLWTELRKGGLIDPEKTDEEIQEEVDASDVGLGLDDAGPAIS